MDTICTAIASRRVLSFYYDGGIRQVEPHAYGISSKGNHVLRAYQVSGYSTSGKPIGWKLFDMSKATSIQIEEQTFNGTRPEYVRNDSAMSTVHCQL